MRYLIILLLILVGCASVHVDKSDNRDITHNYPLHADTTVAKIDSTFGEEDARLALDYQDHMFQMRRHRLYFTSKVGESFVIEYYESKVIYAAILAENNETQEEIVYFRGKWYYNGTRQYMEAISESQAMIFVENIQTRVANIVSEKEN